MPTVPVLDTASGLHCVAGNEVLYRKLLAKFIDQQGSVADNVQNLLTAGAEEDAHRSIHTLKGLAASLGLTRLQEYATLLDTQCKAGIDIRSCLPELAEHMQETIQHIQSFLQTA